MYKRIVGENRRALVTGEFGSKTWWRAIDKLSMRKDKPNIGLEENFI